MDDSDEDQRTVWCGNLSDKVSEEMVYELFLQAAPLQRVRIPKDKDGKRSNYAFITFRHIASVNYAINLLNGTSLYSKRINIKPRNNQLQRQNTSYQEDGQRIPELLSVSTGMIGSFNMLIDMGNQLLIANKSNTDSSTCSYSHDGRSPREHRNWERFNYRDNNSYRRNNNYHSRHGSNSYMPYHHSRKYERR